MTDRRPWLWPGLVALAGALVYANTLGNGFALDDVPLVRDDPRIRSLADLPELFVTPYWPSETGGELSGLYRPLTTASFALNRALSGPAAAGFHAGNVILHAAVCFALWFVLRGAGRHWGTAFAGGLLFAVHPLHTEAVASIAGRAELLGALGVLLAWLAHRRAATARAGAAAGWAACAGGAWLAALLSKENAILAPLCFVLEDRWRGRIRPTAYLAYGAALAIVLGLRVLALGALGAAADVAFLDNPAAFAGPATRWATALWVQVRYARLLVLPHPLSSDYSYDAIPVVESVLDPRAIAGLAWVAVLVAAFALGWKRSRPLALGVAVWTLFLLPTANLLFATGTLMAERLAYLASAGGCLVAGHALAALAARHARLGRAAGAATLGVLALVGSALTVARNSAWRDNLTLSLADRRSQPRSAKLEAGAGIALQASGDAEGAEAAYRRALSIWPDYGQIRFNLGGLLAERGALEEAVAEFHEAAELAPHHPGPPKNLARLLERLGRREQALDWYATASRLDPDDLALRLDHGRALLAAGRDAEARAVLEALERDDPLGPAGRLAAALRQDSLGERERASELYRGLAADPAMPAWLREFVRLRLATLGGA